MKRLLLVSFLLSILPTFAIEMGMGDYVSTMKAYSARIDSEALKESIQLYIESHGQFSDTNSLQDLVSDGYLKIIPKTPNGNTYQHLIIDGEISVYAPGSNGIDDKMAVDDVNYIVKEFDCEIHGVGCLRERIPALLILAGLISVVIFVCLMVLSSIIRVLLRKRNSS